MGMNCNHTKVTEIMTIGSCTLYAGNERQVMPMAGQFEVIISLLGSVRAKQTHFHLSRGSRRVFANLAAYQQKRNNVICIDWPDMQAPDLDREFWIAMVQDLKQVQGKAVLYCMGGHGRTGTALCAIAQIAEYAPAIESGDVIQWVRQNYCCEAVETDSQVRYLLNLGVQTKEEASRSFRVTRKDHCPPFRELQDKDRLPLSKYFQSPMGSDYDGLDE